MRGGVWGGVGVQVEKTVAILGERVRVMVRRTLSVRSGHRTGFGLVLGFMS